MDTNILKKWAGLGLLIAGLFVFFKFYHIEKIAQLPMGSYHTWRQADCIAMTNEFYYGKATLLNPTTHYVKKDGTRLGAGEFPVINMLVAHLYKVFGPSLQVYRYTIYFFYLIGLLFLYLIFYELSRQPINAALFTLLIGSSSVLVFYAINFLPDVPALSIGITGLYIWLLARKKHKTGWYLSSILIVVLACLVKISLMMLLGAFAAVIIVEMVLHGRRSYSFAVMGFILVGLVIIASWYYHAYQLDHLHAPFIFLTETRSYWDTYYLERPLIWKEIKSKWLPQVYLPIVWYFMMGISLIIIAAGRKVRIEQLLLTGTATIAGVCFFAMMYRQFLYHDYLWVCVLIIPVLFTCLMMEEMGNMTNRYAKIAFGLFVLILIILQSFQTKQVLKERYWSVDNNLFYNQQLLEMNRQLRYHGIAKTDLVLSIPDPSPNITLSVMDQYGFTLYRDDKKSEESIRIKMNLGAKYLIVTEPSELEKEYVQPFIKEAFFRYKGISVFKL